MHKKMKPEILKDKYRIQADRRISRGANFVLK